jgi:dipeptidase E
MIKLLLTSSGISNPSIHGALVDLLGKPIAESNALFVPTGIYPFPRCAGMAYDAICGKVASPLCELGWKSLGVLELTALPSIDKKNWVSSAGLGRRPAFSELLDEAIRIERAFAIVAA